MTHNDAWEYRIVPVVNEKGTKVNGLYVRVDTRKGTNPIMEALIPPPFDSLLAAEVADKSPWTHDYDHDWCFYCYGSPVDYGQKPWRGHSDDCLWIRLNLALGRDVRNLVTDSGVI